MIALKHDLANEGIESLNLIDLGLSIVLLTTLVSRYDIWIVDPHR